MQKFLLILLISLSAVQVQALVWDGRAEGLLRTYPQGFYLGANPGASFLLWGEGKGKRQPMYGYIRSSVTGRTSVIVNSMQAQLGIFPVSFAGFYGGITRVSRIGKSLPTYTCQRVHCRGLVKRRYFGSKMALSFKGFFIFSENRWDRLDKGDSTGLFADEQSSLVARDRLDYVTRNVLTLGYDFTANWKGGLLWVYHHMKYHKNSSTMTLLFGQKKIKEWSILVGGGAFKTRDHRYNLTAMTVVRFNFKTGLPIF